MPIHNNEKTPTIIQLTNLIKELHKFWKTVRKDALLFLGCTQYEYLRVIGEIVSTIASQVN